MEEQSVEAWIEVVPMGDDGWPSGPTLCQVDVDGRRLLHTGTDEVLRSMVMEWATSSGIELEPGRYQVVAWWQYEGTCAGRVRFTMA